MSLSKHESSSEFQPLPHDLADVADMDALLQSEARVQRSSMPADLVTRIAAVSSPMLQQAGEPVLKLHEASSEETLGSRRQERARASGSAWKHRRLAWAGLAMAACAAIAVLVMPSAKPRRASDLASNIDPVAEMDLLIAAVDAMDQHATLPALGIDDSSIPEALSDEDRSPLVEIGGSL